MARRRRIHAVPTSRWGEYQPSDVCQLCGSKMVLREGSHGKFYGCSTYPKCDGTREKGSAEKKDTVPRKKPLNPNEKKNTVPRKSPLNPNSDDCPLCGSKMKLRKGPHGEFFGCSTYPKCKGTGKK